ncbi:MAG: hypothetical protein GY760_22490 [Deltaproteobacteria bacterium]|nr:hypothetical protein [Deltaproteobacteria bacterium]
MKIPKLKFNYKITDYVDSHIIKLYIIVLISITVLAVLIIVVLGIYKSGVTKVDKDKPQLYSEQDISSILRSPGLTDFIIPETLEAGENSITLFREPQREWIADVVDHYIIPVEELGIDLISEESKKIIELKLEEIP